MPHEELVTKISTLRAHVQSLRENSESDEPMLDTIYDTLKELEWSLFLEFHQSEKCLEQLYLFKKGMNSTRELCTTAILVPGFHDVEYEEGEPDCSKMPTYTVSHFAKALVSDEDEDKLTAFLQAQGVLDGDPDMTIYNVEFVEIDITEAHFTALKSGELSLNELCSELFSDCEPDCKSTRKRNKTQRLIES